MSEVESQPDSVHDQVGGQPFFDELVERFYRAVEADPVLAPMYPGDGVESRRTLAGFLAQYWGGPPDYSAERGHPRLRMRHAPFVIGQVERDHWLAHMVDAVRSMEAPAEVETEMVEYFERASTAMINSPFRFAPG